MSLEIDWSWRGQARDKGRGKGRRKEPSNRVGGGGIFKWDFTKRF